MRTYTTTHTVYTFDELSDSAKQSAVENLYDINVDYGWREYVYEDAKEIGKLIGIDISNIYFSGFSSQGDGACFEGEYSYRKNSVKKVKEYAPTDKELHSIAKRLQEVQKLHFYGLYASVKHSGHYYHELCTNIDVSSEYNKDFSYDLYEDIQDALRAFMQWIYSRLETEYDYLTSDEAIIETIECNEYEFYEDGTLC